MTNRAARLASRWLACGALAASLLLLGPAAVLAHAELLRSDPANAATLTTPPVEITATYSEPFDTARSSMELRGPGGATLATQQPALAATASSMTISGFGALAPGSYSVQWTTITPDDNGIERGTFTFTVAAGASAPGTASPGPPRAAGTAAASPAPGAGSASGGAGDMALPLVALAVIVVVGLAWFVRRSR